MEIQSLYDALLGHEGVRKALGTLVRGASCSISSPVRGSKPFLASLLALSLKRPLLVVTATEQEAQTFQQDLETVYPHTYLFSDPDFPEIEEDREGYGEQIRILTRLMEGLPTWIVTPLRGLMRRLPPLQLLKSRLIFLKVGEPLNREGLLGTLYEWGYVSSPLVENKGEVSSRGGIVDCFSPHLPLPCRIELQGEEVASLRTFDPVTQRTVEKVEYVSLLPMKLAVKEESLLDSLPRETLLFLDQMEFWSGEIASLEARMAEAEDDEVGRLINPSRLIPALESFLACKILEEGEGISIETEPAPRFQQHLDDLWEMLLRWKGEGKELFFFSRQASRIHDLLLEKGISGIQIFPTPWHGGFLLPQMAVLTDQELFGRVFPKVPPGRARRGAPIRLEETQTGQLVVHPSHGVAQYQGIVSLTVEGSTSDYLCLEFAGHDRLYVPLEEMDRIQRYVGPERSDVVPEPEAPGASEWGAQTAGAKRSGRPAALSPPSLSKLGGKQWKKTTEKVRQGVEEVARDLLSLYAKRAALPGYAFPQDSPWQREMEEAFPYEETPHQEKAIFDVKADMEKPAPMDRLVLGDVGYGKTEVALRAAFKAVTGGKQVVLLVPTTILAQQHFTTFTERLATFPVRVAMLTRFQSPPEQRGILEGIASGKVDVCIGTHRLLQKDVVFSNLGLVILDEEQRFGVLQKEFLKQFQESVDVLVLSATPIPRTLYTSLVSVRDMSLIETPPQDRLPVKTFICQDDPALIQRAIYREMERDGQIFFLHNRIETIYQKAARLSELAPEAKIAVAYGKMREDDLEQTMWEFMEGKHDILVCTTIIENGLDIPRVNSLIVNNAHTFGLAQLYQIRGRVGRANLQAYAYFLVPPEKKLTPEAIKRLETLKEFTHLGSGYQIALRDLEIRGAGDLLGVRQHGYIGSVGFHLYCELLSEAVRRLKGEEREGREIPVTVTLPLPAFIPDEYVPHPPAKLSLYRKMARARRVEEVDELEEEMKDCYGPLPPEADFLLRVLRMKLYAREHGFYAIRWQGNKVLLDAPASENALTIPCSGTKGEEILSEVEAFFVKARRLSVK